MTKSYFEKMKCHFRELSIGELVADLSPTVLLKIWTKLCLPVQVTRNRMPVGVRVI